MYSQIKDLVTSFKEVRVLLMPKGKKKVSEKKAEEAEENVEKEEPPVYDRCSPVITELPDYSPSSTPVLEAYVEDPTGKSKRMMAPKSKLYESQKPTEVIFEIPKLSKEYDGKKKKSAPKEQFADFQIPALSLSKSKPISTDPKQKFKISDLLKASPEGSTLNIPDGTYEESISISKKISLTGSNKVKIVSPDGKSRPSVTIKTPNVSISGITINAPNDSCSILVESGSCLVEKCNIVAEKMPAIAVAPKATIHILSSDLTSTGNIIFANDGIVNAEKCTMHDSKEDIICLKGQSVCKINGCTISNSSKSGLLCADSASFIMSACNISGCGTGIQISSSGAVAVISETTIDGCNGSGIEFCMTSQGHVIGCKLTNHSGPGLLVNDGAGIFMKNNTFDNCGNPSALFVHANASVVSNSDTFNGCGPNVAIIAGAGQFTKATLTSSRGNGFVSVAAGTVTLSACKIKGAHQCGAIAFKGGTIGVAETTIEECEFGLAVLKGTSAMRKSKFNKNRRSGAVFIECPKTVVDGCTASENYECGFVIIQTETELSKCESTSNCFVGLEISKSKTTMTGCTVNKNGTGGVSLKEGAELTADSLTAQQNSIVGVSLEGKSRATIEKSEVSNTAGIGLTVVRQSELTLNNSSVSSSRDLGLQIEGRSTKLNMEGTTVNGCPIGLVASDNAKVALKGGSFKKNDLQCELRDSASLKSSSVTYSHGEGTVAIHILRGSTASISGGTIKENEGIAIVNGSEANISKVKMVGNTSLGILQYGQTSKSTINACTFTENGEAAVYVRDGETTLTSNTVEDHSAAGFILGARVISEISDNSFGTNGLMDINRE